MVFPHAVLNELFLINLTFLDRTKNDKYNNSYIFLFDSSNDFQKFTALFSIVIKDLNKRFLLKNYKSALIKTADIKKGLLNVN